MEDKKTPSVPSLANGFSDSKVQLDSPKRQAAEAFPLRSFKSGGVSTETPPAPGGPPQQGP